MVYIYYILFCIHFPYSFGRKPPPPWKSQYQLLIHQLRQTLRPKREIHIMLLWSFVLFQISAISVSVSVWEQLQPIQLFTSQLVTSSDKFSWDIPPGISAGLALAWPNCLLNSRKALKIKKENPPKKKRKKIKNYRKWNCLSLSFRVISVTSVNPHVCLTILPQSSQALSPATGWGSSSSFSHCTRVQEYKSMRWVQSTKKHREQSPIGVRVTQR